ncbi:MAG: lysophospholipid acyltransferase family protein [Pseudomonadota bacterium]
MMTKEPALNSELAACINNKKWSLIGGFFYYVIPYRKKVILENMHRVFKDSLTHRQIKKLSCLFYKHLFSALLDSLKIPFLSRKKIKQYGKIIGLQHIEEAIKQDKGILLLTGHFGSWELGTVATLANSEKKFYGIRRQIKNKCIERLLFKNYRKMGIEVIPKNNKSLLKIYNLLRKKNIICFVLDQHAHVKNGDGIMVEFFGEKCGTYQALARLAQKLHTPVVPAYLYKDENNQHILEFLPALAWQACNNKAEEVYQNTLIYNQCLEKMLLRHPEQWLWSHRRWKGEK